MLPDRQAKRKWVFYGRWALIPATVGILIVAFVIVTGGKLATWSLWIAVPLIMIGLGYIFIINAIASLISIGGSDEQPSGEEDREDAA